ncbi:phosphate ABC transporter substrate-binding protein [Alcanivorax xiamenensis]|uniref:Phosphate ABC transporter substrate-binding protein n=1 Tax=Alcanivorax xiamenensis TaxID=1177156 RepID=A0ABQ6YB69_9GAMM|nr:substrate-binding domain-containing protein [Alcanivorax xiamenensis]KAF0807285.1 phosphate ABC transporter substrate-binding protein [Alcanivorax xiamenensis]
MNTILKKAALVAAIMSAPFAASAANLVGGGASLPAVAYVGDGFTVPDPQARLSSSVLFAGINPGTGMPYNQVTADGTSIFGIYNQGANNASYCQTGSSTGKRVLLSAADEIASGNCKDYSDSADGFSGPNALPDFAGSDAPLTAGDISKFIDSTNGYQSQRTNLVQVPALGAFLGLPMNIQDGSGNPITNVDLSTAEVCSIFDGSATVWSDVGVPSSQQIKVVYRSDGSGTTFAFTQYLASACNISATTFQTEELYSDAISLTVYGSRSVGGSGNGGVIDAVTSTPGAIGYANFSNVAAEPGLAYALVEGHDPASGGSIVVADPDILIDTVLGNPGSNGLPTTQSLSSAGGTQVGCLAVVNPAIQLTQSYPIVAFTNLLTYTNNNPNATAVESLFMAVSNASGLPVGYAPVSSGKIDNVINNCIN